MLTLERFYVEGDDITEHVVMSGDTHRDEWGVEFIAPDDDDDSLSISIKVRGRANWRKLCELFQECGLGMLEPPPAADAVDPHADSTGPPSAPGVPRRCIT